MGLDPHLGLSGREALAAACTSASSARSAVCSPRWSEMLPTTLERRLTVLYRSSSSGVMGTSGGWGRLTRSAGREAGDTPERRRPRSDLAGLPGKARSRSFPPPSRPSRQAQALRSRTTLPTPVGGPAVRRSGPWRRVPWRPLRGRAVVLFAGQVAHEPVEQGCGRSLTACQIDQGAAEDDLLGPQGGEPNPCLGVALFGALELRLDHGGAPPLRTGPPNGRYCVSNLP